MKAKTIILFNHKGGVSKTLKTKLKNIITRRNQIVHEGDCFSVNSSLHHQYLY